MSHQARTWVETKDEATGLARWDVLINGTPVPGGYVLQREPGAFEAHYPHVAPFTKPTLAAAQERLEWAPPVTAGVARIGREAPADPDDELLDLARVGELLGVSAPRVSAMIANGRLAARRAADGTRLVSRASVEALAAAAAPR